MVTEYSAGPVAPPGSHRVCAIVDLTSCLLDLKFYLAKTTWSFPRVSQNGFPGVGFRGKQQHCKLQFTVKSSSRNLKYKCLKTEMWVDFNSNWSPSILFHFKINSLLQKSKLRGEIHTEKSTSTSLTLATQFPFQCLWKQKQNILFFLVFSQENAYKFSTAVHLAVCPGPVAISSHRYVIHNV